MVYWDSMMLKHAHLNSTSMILLGKFISCSSLHMFSGITSGRVLDGELLYTKILEVNLFVFAYKLFHGNFSPIDGTLGNIPSIGEKFP